MRTLDRHIAIHVIRGSVLTLLVLLAVFSIADFLDDLSNVGKANYSMTRAIEYMILTTPHRVFALFPLAAVIGSLIGLGTLAANKELVVVRAAGVSTMRIAGAAMMGAALLVVGAVLVGEVLAPYAERLALERRASALSNRIAMETRHGFWVRDGSSFINVRQLLPDNLMGDLYIYEFDEGNRLKVATHADWGKFVDGKWNLRGIRQSIINEDGVTRREMDTASWFSRFEPDLADVVSVRLESLSALGLYRYIQYLRSNGLETARHELALWSKFAYPLATGVMILIALPLVLGRLGSVNIGQRIFVGALIAVSFHVIQQSSGHLGTGWLKPLRRRGSIQLDEPGARQSVVPREVLPIHDHPQVAGTRGQPGEYRGCEPGQALSPARWSSTGGDQAHIPGTHRQRLSTVGPAPSEVKERDKNQIRAVTGMVGTDGLAAGKR
jgi:lipopolysaccharide export system permease protein